MSHRRTPRARELAEDEEEPEGFRIPGIVLAFVATGAVVVLLLWLGPRLGRVPTEAAGDDASPTEDRSVPAKGGGGADPFASVPDEEPPKPKDRSPFAGLDDPTTAPDWVAALAHVEEGETLTREAYARLEVVGEDGAEDDGYGARLRYLRALDVTEKIGEYLDAERGDDATLAAMHALRESWKKKVAKIDRDFGLVPRK